MILTVRCHYLGLELGGDLSNFINFLFQTNEVNQGDALEHNFPVLSMVR